MNGALAAKIGSAARSLIARVVSRARNLIVTGLRRIVRPRRRRCYVAILTLIVGIDVVIVVADVDAVLGYGAAARSVRRDATGDFTCRSALARLTDKVAVQKRALAYTSARALVVVGAGVSVVASLICERCPLDTSARRLARL